MNFFKASLIIRDPKYSNESFLLSCALVLTAKLLTLVAPLIDDCWESVPKGLITVDTARFNLLGDLLKLKARLTFLPVRVANLRELRGKRKKWK